LKNVKEYNVQSSKTLSEGTIIEKYDKLGENE
jgi:hypothetical protein